MRHYKKGIKAIVKAPTVRNHEAVYIHFGQRQTRYIETPKRTHSYSNILFSKGFLTLTLASEMLWQAISVETLTRTYLQLDAPTKTDDMHFIIANWNFV